MGTSWDSWDIPPSVPLGVAIPPSSLAIIMFVTSSWDFHVPCSQMPQEIKLVEAVVAEFRLETG
jgi:hypothetical protein